MKKIFAITAAALIAVIAITACSTNPMTGKKTMALVDNESVLASSFSQYQEFLDQSKVITGTKDAQMVERLGDRIKKAAEVYLASKNQLDAISAFQWEYHLVESDEVNAWCMPGGKIVVYTGILPVTQDEDSLAVVMGHEVCHAILNHGQQSMSASVLQEMGAVGVGLLFGGSSAETQQVAQAVYGTGSQLGGTLPFSRKHESEADHYGLILMAVAGYNPDKAVTFWQRMEEMSGGATPELLSTHPSDATRIKQIQEWIPEAKQIAKDLGTVQ
jgi:predicted Zn-dependent protease